MPITLDIKKDKSITIELNAKRSLDGNIMIFDHEDIDIVLMMEQSKCLTFPKKEMSDKVYYSQDRMFDFLSKKGIIDPSSIQGGNIYGSMEAKVLESKIPGIDAMQATLFTLYEYIKEEKPYFKSSEKIEMDRLDKMLRPDDEDSTDLGDVPQDPYKGSMSSRVRPYGFRYNYSLIRESEESEK